MNKTIIFGITGSIAAYKACEIIRRLKNLGFNIHPVLTKNAKRFISPLTIATLSQNPVSSKLSFHMEHLEECSLIVIAPCSCNVIGKIASGIADDLLTSIALARKAPILIAPAMNEGMYLNPITQRNIRILKSAGIIVIEPERGSLAKGEGLGRLANQDVIVNAISSLLERRRAISGKNVLITAGATIEPIDPIRFISNRSSGIMGHSLAERFSLFGASTTLVTTTDIPTSSSIKRYNVKTAIEMEDIVNKLFNECDIFISSAAVCDFKPSVKSSTKIKDKEIELKLIRNPDILEGLGKKRGNKTLVGFSVEVEKKIEYAKEKLQKKNLDMIVISQEKDFGSSKINPTILYKNGNIEEFEEISKIEFSDILIERIERNKAL